MKATPDISLVKVNTTTSELELPSNPGTVNPYDEYTIEECIRLRERFGGKCAVLCVGSDKSEVALRECLALGVDEAYLAVDPLFDGSDSQATAKVLSAALKKIGDYTIVLSGKQSADFESSQTPAALAVLSGNPGINSVKKIEDIKDNTVSVRRATDSGYEVVEA
ncbi:MAG: electron transfer flavoprotein subunit beta, partial [candidate division Zixibacteria bacterium]|nr:electron transfer flavoprotein subunit beta [candidate division Zixibacteria bacterium]